MTPDAEPDKPLAGKKVVVTRDRAQAGKLAQMLEDLGATVIEFPTIEIRAVDPPPTIPPLTDFDWVVFTSTNAVNHFLDLVDGADPARDLRNCRVCAIGPGTTTALRDHGAKVDLMAGDHIQEGVLDALRDEDPLLPTRRVLVPKGDLARDVLADSLSKLGANVTAIVIYRNAIPETSDATVHSLLDANPDILTFTSASTARNFAHIVGREGLLRLRKTVVACIGPETSAAAREAGMCVDIEPGKHDLWSLAKEIANFQIA
jgi:uroporphyrinogen III methyltransferase/synthase